MLTMLDLRNKNKELKKQNQQLLTTIEIYAQIIKRIKPKIQKQIQRIPFSTHKQKPSSPISACLLLGDWHIGEIVKPEEINKINKYNLKIARNRLNRIVETFLRYIANQKNIYNIPECHIIGLGDYISGVMVKELEKYCEFPISKQIVEAAFLLAKVLISIKPYFKKVYFHGISADNHGRLGEEYEFKQSAFSNVNYCLLNLTKALCRFPETQFRILPGVINRIKINGVPMLITHGHTIRSWQGIPFYGLDKFKLSELLKARKNKENNFEYCILGHFHRPIILEDIIINGSLVGPDEYSNSKGACSDPVQLAFLIHPKWHAFNFIQLFG